MTKIKPINKSFRVSDGWKVGDRVLCLFSDAVSYSETKTYTLAESLKEPGLLGLAECEKLGYWGEFRLMENSMEYENKWRLNDGTETIPDNAQKLEHEGSVVAYRLPIEKVEVGDYVVYSGDRYEGKVLAIVPTNLGEAVVMQRWDYYPSMMYLRNVKLVRKGS